MQDRPRRRSARSAGAAASRASTTSIPISPKGYQISQYDEPLVRGRPRRVRARRRACASVRLTRIHMEEDAGKNIARRRRAATRSSTTTAPACRSSRSSASPTCARPPRRPRTCARFASWCAGSASPTATWRRARCAATPTSACGRVGETKLGTKAELKNMNSFKHVEAAIEYEIARQIDAASRAASAWCRRRACGTPTRARRTRCAQRSRRTTIATSPSPTCRRSSSTRRGSRACAATLPELPIARRQRFIDALGLSAYDAGVLTAEQRVADYFDAVVALGADAEAGGQLDHRRDARALNATAVDRRRRSRRALAELIALVERRDDPRQDRQGRLRQA